MHEIFNNSFHKHSIVLYKNNVATEPDSTPLVNVYDASTGSALVTSASAISEGRPGEYYYQITPSLSSVDRNLRIQWNYSYSGASVSEDSFAAIVTPYATLSEIIFELKIGTSPSDENYIDPEQILSAERLARIQINNYTGQVFNKRQGSQSVYGIGADSLFLTEKMLSVSSIEENDFVVYTASPYYNALSNYDIVLSETGKTIYLTPMSNQINSYASDPFGTNAGNRFINGNRYNVTGSIGWQFVPQDIRAACVLLCGDILTRDYEWRNKYLNNINLSEVSFELNSAAYLGTGNAIVDSILDTYKNVGIVII